MQAKLVTEHLQNNGLTKKLAEFNFETNVAWLKVNRCLKFMTLVSVCTIYMDLHGLMSSDNITPNGVDILLQEKRGWCIQFTQKGFIKPTIAVDQESDIEWNCSITRILIWRMIHSRLKSKIMKKDLIIRP